MLVAAGVVTWMLFWMRRQAASVKGELQAAVDRALTEGSIWGLAFLAFTAVIREGIETSLFLVGQVNSADDAASSVLVGAARRPRRSRSGIGYVFYQGTPAHQPRLVLPLDRRRPDLHRGRAAQPRDPRVHRGRRHHGRDADRVRHQRGPAARGRHRAVPASAVRLHLDAGGHHVRGLGDVHRRRAGAVPAAGPPLDRPRSRPRRPRRSSPRSSSALGSAPSGGGADRAEAGSSSSPSSPTRCRSSIESIRST